MNRPLTVGAEEFSDADWRIAAVACRSNPDALAEALSLRATEGWRDQEERTAVLNCITEADAARFGIQKYSFAPDEGGQIQITLGSGQGTFQSGDIVKRLMVFDDQGARREVIRLSSVEAFQSALSNYAFRDGYLLSDLDDTDAKSLNKRTYPKILCNSNSPESRHSGSKKTGIPKAVTCRPNSKGTKT